MKHVRGNWMLAGLLAGIFCLGLGTVSAQEWHSNGPYGADVTCLEVAGWDSSKVIAGTRFDGLYIRDLEGSRWERFAPGLPQWPGVLPRSPEDDFSQDVTIWGGDHPPVHSFSTSPGSHRTVLVGLGSGLFYSRDGGETFQMLYDGHPLNEQILQVWSLPGDPDCMLFLSEQSSGESTLHVTTSAGFEWVSLPYSGVEGFAVDPHDPTHLFMYGEIEAEGGMDAGLFESHDAGYTWTARALSLSRVHDLSFNPAVEGSLVGIGQTQSSAGIFYSHDGMESFSSLPETQSARWVEYLMDELVLTSLQGQPWAYQSALMPQSGGLVEWDEFVFSTTSESLQPDPASVVDVLGMPGPGEVVFLATRFGVVYSRELGGLTEWWDEGLNNARIDRVVASTTTDHVWYAYGQGGAWVTVNDGNEWSRLIAHRTWGFAQRPETDHFVLACDEAFYGGESNTGPLSLLNGDGTAVKLIYTGPDTLWAVDAFGAQLRDARYSLDEGDTWQDAFSFQMTNEVHLSSTSNHSLIVGAESMLRLEADATEPDVIGLPGAATSVETGFSDPDYLVMTISNNVYQSQNGGQTWSSLGSQFVPRCTGGKSMGAIGRDGVSETGLYALIRGEFLYHRIGVGSPWIQVERPDDLDWRTIDFAVSRDSLIALATHSKGVWIRGGLLSDIPEVTESVIGNPSSYSLSDAWPNPFNPSTRLEFTLAHPGVAEVAVYDLTGRLVTTLAKGSYSAGKYGVNWDASGVASGVYFVRLQTDQGGAVRKVVRLQ